MAQREIDIHCFYQMNYRADYHLDFYKNTLSERTIYMLKS